MNEQPLITERRDRVLLIKLNRPDARNAVNLAMAEAMSAALDELDAADELSLGVITGEGKGFSSGMDLKAFATGERPWAGDRGFAGIVQKPAEKPLIAAIEGFAVAGGLEIALACDLIVAARGAKLGIPEAKRGLVAAAGALRQLPRRLPAAIAMELALTGETIDAERGAELGLINRLAEPGKALETALELAEEVAANAPLALRASKTVLKEQWSWDDQTFWEKQGEAVGPVFSSEDAIEGATAFSEKRAPTWKGR
jgi:enoyl-CoA hydratase/carnithine racemase